MDRVGDIFRFYCNSCGANTKHDVLFSDSGSGAVESGVFEYEKDLVVECRGCCTRSFIRKIIRKSTGGVDSVESIVSEDWYPPRMVRRSPKWISELDGEVGDIYREIISGLHCGYLRLSVMGARALLERLMIEKVGDNGSFEKNMKKMVEGHHISENQHNILKSMIGVGHAVMHRGWTPDEDTTHVLFDLVDALVYITCIAKDRGEVLRRVTPPRNPPKAVA